MVCIYQTTCKIGRQREEKLHAKQKENNKSKKTEEWLS